MTDFCTCDKQQRRLYADKCLNCDLPIKAMRNFSSAVKRTQGTCTLNIFGRHIEIVGNQAVIVGVEGQQDYAVEGANAGDVMSQIQEWIKARGTAPVVSQNKLIRVAADELLGCLKRRRSAVGEACWIYYTLLAGDYNSRGVGSGSFFPALKLLRSKGLVTVKDGSVKLKEESDE